MFAEWFVNLLTAYAVVGLLFGAAFVTVGVDRVDPVAKGSAVGFRLLILPGVAALWPVPLKRWLS